MRRTAVVTGASSGIGAASARALAADGFKVVCVARRGDRLIALAQEIAGSAVVCDVTDAASVAHLAQSLKSESLKSQSLKAQSLKAQSLEAGSLEDVAPNDVAVLVNSAGGAFDQATIEEADPEVWARTFDVNALSIVRVTQALLPALRAGSGGLVINIGSTAGRVPYEGGGGYTTAKHAVRVITATLRLELVAEPLRFTEIAPGMVKTEEFALNRVGGDRQRYDAIYRGVAEPLLAEDIAETVRWVASLPSHVNIDEIVMRPRAQAAQHKVHREE